MIEPLSILRNAVDKARPTSYAWGGYSDRKRAFYAFAALQIRLSHTRYVMLPCLDFPSSKSTAISDYKREAKTSIGGSASRSGKEGRYSGAERGYQSLSGN